MPKVSIIVPVYNVEKYISTCIDSIINQTFTDFEILVVDDGSPDKSIEKIKKYEDSRIIILRKDNGGLSDARNYGLERASGKYILFVDSDDWVEADLLKDCVEILDNNTELDLIIMGYIKDYEDISGTVIRSINVLPEKNIFSVREKNLNIDSHLIDLMGYSVNKLYRNNLLKRDNLKFPQGITLVEDAIFNFTVFQKVNFIFFLDKAYYHYRIKPIKTLMTTFRNDPFELILMKTKALESLVSSWNMPNAIMKKALSISLTNGLIYCFNNILVFKNSLCNKQKKEYIDSMLNHPLVKEWVKYYPAISVKEKILKFLIQKNSFSLIKFFFSTRQNIIR
ncbi:MAG: putative glycosyltransferase EpsJ [Petrimonas sp.]|jgi:glycosyltransferase involved in cell wall biosynthesis|uniref:glycosyltransferase family 2 protein n=1 Tax=Petrimonas sp. TaxID=2023866 RepID=UPI0030D1BD1F